MRVWSVLWKGTLAGVVMWLAFMIALNLKPIVY